VRFRFTLTSALSLLASLAFLAPLTSCNSPSRPNDPSLVVEPSLDEKVQNGTAFDYGVIDVHNAQLIVLPSTAIVRRGGEAGKVSLFMAKTLAFAGHPKERIDLGSARKYMGCAFLQENGGIVISTYGEWDSVTGGAVLRLLAVVPDGIRVELRKGLWGPDSEARRWHDTSFRKPPEAKDWYGPTTPTPGWTAIPTAPDPRRTASEPASHPAPQTRTG
jgi:hypothetical protein